MKTLATFLLLSALTLSLSAADNAAKPAPAATPKDAADAAPMIPVTAAKITAPFVLKDGAVSQPAQTEVAGGGKAIFTFTVPKDGDYVIHAIVNAPDEDSNSFFLNIDGTPEDPLMIWDMEVTQGFQERIVSWRGGGDSASDEFAPKIFKLKAGEHQLNVIGREPSQLKSVSIRPAPAAAAAPKK
ncbi:MAG TPA: hypothetical protein VHD62_16065 [Opitutaceae bacterium]|nr:hypothetical protein [Opitutaceae bacterium]